MLLIADIGGYTEYMSTHRMSLAHAEVNTARLLEKMIDAAPGFDLIEIEGDAAFLSRQADARDGRRHGRRDPRGRHRPCTGPSTSSGSTSRRTCARATGCKEADNLKLKFVAHIGDVATQTIRQRLKLVGIDVILVHRMLKNPVEIPEYVLLSEELYRTGEAPLPDPVHEVSQDLEGIGPSARTSSTWRTSRTPRRRRRTLPIVHPPREDAVGGRRRHAVHAGAAPRAADHLRRLSRTRGPGADPA